MNVLVSGWVGSSNLGDELALAGLVRELRSRGAAVAALSLDPSATRRGHRIGAVGALRPVAVTRAVRSADALVFGGGGLVQDETSPLNLPFHLSRPWLAERLSVPWAAIGVGVGPLTTRFGRRLARRLSGAVTVVVRDEPSAALLHQAGVTDVVVGCDLAFHLPRPAVAPEDRIAVSLRPWTGRRSRLPVSARRQLTATPGWFVARAALALDRLSDRTGLPVRFVALQADRDGPLHAEVGARMQAPRDHLYPPASEAVAAFAASRLVVAMRYHALVAAVLAGRPAVAIGYSPKVGALAEEVGPGARVLGWDDTELPRLPDAAAAVMDNSAAVDAAYLKLSRRAAANGRAIDRLLAAAG